MIIGILSDTHDHVPHIEEAVALFRRRKAELVIHAGDYCSPFTIPLFEGLPMHGIFGNNDGDTYLLMKKSDEAGVSIEGGFWETQAGGRRLAVYHGTHAGITAALVESGRYDIVISGHTHRASVERRGGTLALNPGTAHGFDGDATVALLDTEAMEAEIISLPGR